MRLAGQENPVYLFPADHAPVEPARTEVASVDGVPELIAGDAFGQRVGPGVSTVPPFTCEGLGLYRRPDDGADRLEIDDAIELQRTGSTWSVAPPPATGDCTAGRPIAEVEVIVDGQDRSELDLSLSEAPRPVSAIISRPDPGGERRQGVQARRHAESFDQRRARDEDVAVSQEPLRHQALVGSPRSYLHVVFGGAGVIPSPSVSYE